MNSHAGSPALTLRAALRRLHECGDLLAVSAFYETEPVGYTDQPMFVNAAALLQTDLSPEELMQQLLQIERSFGRDRSATLAKGPRTLDLDLLLMDELVLDTPLLTLPHPAIADRRFVLAPLAEIAPEMRHPLLHKTIAELLAALADEGVNRAQAVRRCDSRNP